MRQKDERMCEIDRCREFISQYRVYNSDIKSNISAT